MRFINTLILNYFQKHGGRDNAHTDMEHTTFYFEVQERFLNEALDRFAQFFIQPLMKVETMTREREAVHSGMFTRRKYFAPFTVIFSL